MKKSLHDYILGLRKTYKLRIKVANVSELSSSDMDRIENYLKKYDLVKIKNPKKTIFQTHALGFDEPNMSEVYIVEVTLGLPVSKYILQRAIAKVLKISDMYVAVEGDVEENQADFQKYQENKDEPEFGDKYNEEMLKTIEKDRKQERKRINKTAE